ncbi:DUF1893 domain-containing protein [Candidatus Woesearchaeota archaeon]|nr:DUF1893 domain-containing protein [Candidatus Woesearchaeota archaeon]
MKPDFEKYSLALIKNNKVVYSSDKPGLRPLVNCIAKNKEKKDCALHDKVIGLAAAKLVFNSGIAEKIVTSIISKPAFDFLKDKLVVEYDEIVKNILNTERKVICPMEKKALELDEASFLRHVNKIFNQE